MKPWPLSAGRTAPALLVALLGAACQATSPVDPLPYHVAMIPTRVIKHDEPPGAMSLSFEAREISDRLKQRLKERGFTEVSLLEEPPGEHEPYGDRDWQEAARRKHADLLLRTQLEYEPRIDGARNEKFWLNLPLFLLGGPMCWFIGDRRYEATATLQAEFFDAATFHELGLEDWRLFSLLQTEFTGTDLNLVKRADGPEDYALSLLVPAGLLAPESERVADEVARKAVDTLSEGLLQKIHTRRAEFDFNDVLAQFGIESERATVTREPDGRVTVRVPVQDQGRSGSLRGTLVDAGGRELSGDYLEGPGPDGRFEFMRAYPLPAGERFVSVRLDDGSDVRSFTFQVPVP